MKFEKVPEGLALIDETLAGTDNTPHPFLDPLFRETMRAMGGVLTTSPNRTKQIIETAVKRDLPVEERKRQEARAAGKPFRVPEWWRGEQANYKVAKQMMTTLPKKIGPIKE